MIKPLIVVQSLYVFDMAYKFSINPD